MAKNMARLDSSNIVTGVEWWADRQEETDSLKNCLEKPVTFGDEYIDGKFYRDGEEVLSALEEAELALRIISGEEQINDEI